MTERRAHSMAEMKERFTVAPHHVSVLFRSGEHNRVLAEAFNELHTMAHASGIEVQPVFLDFTKNLPIDEQTCIPEKRSDILPEVIAHSFHRHNRAHSIRGLDLSHLKDVVILGLPEDIDRIAENLPKHLENGMGGLRGKVKLCRVTSLNTDAHATHPDFTQHLTPTVEHVMEVVMAGRTK